MKGIFEKLKNSLDRMDLFLLAWLSVLLHFWRISYPNSVVFDEVTFGKFLNSYAQGKYYFDLHPPLGKLLLYWVGSLGGLDPSFNYDKIGTVFTNGTYLWLRAFTAFAGALIPIFVCLLMRGLDFSPRVALLAGLFVIFENALTVISRTFVFDIFLLSFGFAALATGVWAHRRQSRGLWWTAWILGAAAFSIKWTGFSFLGILSLWEIQKVWKTRQWPEGLQRLGMGWGIAALFYFMVFVAHFSWTPNSGIGNDFMSAEFQSGLVGSRYYGAPQVKPLNVWDQFKELNKMMWSYQKTMHQSHPYSSRWYSWPFLYRPIYFWGNTDGVLKERIYMLGNPWLWWFGTLAVIGFVFRKGRLWREWLDQSLNGSQSREFFLVILFMANYLPFIFIGRVMFLYHYLVALIAALMILAIAVDSLSRRWWVWGFVLGAIASFWFFAPLTYALPLSDLEYNARLWFATWL